MDKNGAVVSSRSTPAGKEDDEAFLHAQELVHSCNISMVLKAAIELGLLDALTAAGCARTAQELAAQIHGAATAGRIITEAAALSVDRVLRFLASYKVVSCSTETGPDGAVLRRYTPAPACRYLTTNHSKGSLAPLALFAADEDFLKSWQNLAAAVAGGGGSKAFERAHGLPIFEYMGTDQRLSALFDQAMAQQTLLVINKLLEHTQVFDGVAVLVDVGGGTGESLAMIISRYKHIRGINYDLPHVTSQAPSLPGVEHVAGNMFESVPAGDAVFLKWMIHMYSDEDCIKILKNCHRALSENGKAIIVQSILPPTPETTQAARDSFMFDMIMLAHFHGGKERTEKEFTKLATDSGFTGAFRSTYIFGNLYTLEFFK